MNRFSPTNRATIREALSLANVLPGERLVDLGSGDGRVVRIARDEFGADAYGVEIDPELCRKSRRAGIRVDNYDFAIASLAGVDVACAFLDDCSAVNLEGFTGRLVKLNGDQITVVQY